MHWRLPAAILLMCAGPALIALGLLDGDDLLLMAALPGLLMVGAAVYLLREESRLRAARDPPGRMPWWRVAFAAIGGNMIVGAVGALWFGWLYIVAGAAYGYGWSHPYGPYSGAAGGGGGLVAYGEMLMAVGAVAFVFGLLLVVLPWLPWVRWSARWAAAKQA